MQIQISKPRKIDHPLRDDAAVADDDNRVWANRRELVAEFGVVLDGRGLHDGNAQVDCGIFHWRNGHFHPASARAIGLRHHQRHGMSSADQFLKGRDSETWSTAGYLSG